MKAWYPLVGLAFAVTTLQSFVTATPSWVESKASCNACGYNCHPDCSNCGRCNTKPGCDSEQNCMGPCNGGKNAMWCGGGNKPSPGPAPPTPPPSPGQCHECGYNCDANCHCGHCNTKPGCESKDSCLGNCNSGGNAKWCGGGTPPKPSPSPPKPGPSPPAPGGQCHACGYECDANCHCGRCNTKPGCDSEGTCLGNCNGGGNAKWCGAPAPAPPPLPPLPPAPGPVVWSTKDNRLLRNGSAVVLHGLGTTCTEYLIRGIGMKCFVNYNFPDPANLLAVNPGQLIPLLNILRNVSSSTVVPVVRIPLTASSWMGAYTHASAGNMAKYPHLDLQYRKFIATLVENYTSYGIATVLDLHWTDDDTNNGPMAGKNANFSAVGFWDSVASTFASNTLVLYELYNEPHTNSVDQWMHGDAKTSGMLEMLAAVRKHTTNAPVIIAGYREYAYDADSLVTLDKTLKAQGDDNILFNFHPYMGPNQAGSANKCPDGFEAMVQRVFNGSAKPAIITEFGQACCSTSGPCEQCPPFMIGNRSVGYDEAILSIAAKYHVSWMPWAWRPTVGGPNTKTCEDINGGDSPPGESIVHPTDGKGADFLTLWNTYANPSGHGGACPGGSLPACMAMCPSAPPIAYKDCVAACVAKCE